MTFPTESLSDSFNAIKMKEEDTLHCTVEGRASLAHTFCLSFDHLKNVAREEEVQELEE